MKNEQKLSRRLKNNRMVHLADDMISLANVNVNNNSINRLQLSLNGKGCVGLLDSGASVSCISIKLFKSSHCCQRYQFKHNSVKRIVGVGGHVTNVLGAVNLPLKISGLQLWHNFIVLPHCDNSPQLILGDDFLKAQKANWDWDTDIVSFQKGMVTAHLTAQVDLRQDQVFLVRTVSDIVVPSQSEIILPVSVIKTQEFRSRF